MSSCSNIKSKSLNKYYLLLISQILSLQITHFIELTLHDVFAYKVGAFTYFSSLKNYKSCKLKNFWNKTPMNWIKLSGYNFAARIKWQKTCSINYTINPAMVASSLALLLPIQCEVVILVAVNRSLLGAFVWYGTVAIINIP